MTDTTTEAVGRLAQALEYAAPIWVHSASPRQPEMSTTGKAAATLRALAQERDAAVACAERWDTEAAAAKIIIPRLEAERDALRAEVERLTAEVASLRLTLGGKTFSASVPEPIGCPLPGACATVAEIVRGREAAVAWLRVIQAENTCAVTGKPCDAVRCGCSAEQEMLIREAKESNT